MLVFSADKPPEKSAFVWGELARSNWMVPVTEGSRLSGVGPAPAVVSSNPLVPEPAPPEPTVVPPGPPPVDNVVVEPPSVPVISPEGAPSGVAPVRVRRISVSAMSRS